MKIYLDEKIKINGIEVGHTYEGCKYLIDHYTHMLANARPEQMGEKEKQHCKWLIQNLTIHKQLYENLKPKSDENQNNSVPQSI